MKSTLSWLMLGKRRCEAGVYGVLKLLTWFRRITTLLERRPSPSVPRSFSLRFALLFAILFPGGEAEINLPIGSKTGVCGGTDLSRRSS